jgi:hypothetical protein
MSEGYAVDIEAHTGVSTGSFRISPAMGLVHGFLLSCCSRCIVSLAARRLLRATVAAAVLCCRLLTALLMTLAPASVECGEEGLVESIMVFSLVLGLTLGALAGWLWLL